MPLNTNQPTTDTEVGTTDLSKPDDESDTLLPAERRRGCLTAAVVVPIVVAIITGLFTLLAEGIGILPELLAAAQPTVIAQVPTATPTLTLTDAPSETPTATNTPSAMPTLTTASADTPTPIVRLSDCTVTDNVFESTGFDGNITMDADLIQASGVCQIVDDNPHIGVTSVPEGQSVWLIVWDGVNYYLHGGTRDSFSDNVTFRPNPLFNRNRQFEVIFVITASANDAQLRDISVFQEPSELPNMVTVAEIAHFRFKKVAEFTP